MNRPWSPELCAEVLARHHGREGGLLPILHALRRRLGLMPDAAERLVYMANQIARFFVTQPGAEADERIADHLNAFWDPSMRRAIAAHLARGHAGLDPAAREAVRLIRATTAEPAPDEAG